MKGQNKLQKNSDINFNKFLIEFPKAVGCANRKAALLVTTRGRYASTSRLLSRRVLFKRDQHLNLKKSFRASHPSKMNRNTVKQSRRESLTLALSPKEYSITIPIVIITISGTVGYL